jgi:hypothetical protein
MISVIHLLASVVLIRFASKRMRIFMKVMKTIMGLNIVIGALNIIAVILYFL